MSCQVMEWFSFFAIQGPIIQNCSLNYQGKENDNIKGVGYSNIFNTSKTWKRIRLHGTIPRSWYIWEFLRFSNLGVESVLKTFPTPLYTTLLLKEVLRGF